MALRAGVPHGKWPPCLFCAYRSSVSGDITYSICHVTSQDHLIKESYDSTGGSS